MACDNGNVLATLAEREHPNRNDCEPIVQILPEGPLTHSRFEISVGRSDKAHIYPANSGSAHGTYLAFLQYAQEFRLEEKGKLPDFIEENAAAVR
jgi:hypothetical protein